MNQFHAQPTKTGSVHVRKLCYSLGLWLILVSDALLNHIVSVFVTITIAVFTKVITIIVIIIFMIVVVVIIIITYRILT